MKTWIASGLFVLLSCAALFSQQPSGKLSFEVASIKPSAPQQMGRIRVGMNADAGMLRYTNVSLRDVIRTAYRVKDYQIEGPDWLGSERFDIEAKFPAGATREQVPEMLQALLADRFKLSLHRDKKEHAIYALVVGKNGPKLKPAETQLPESMQGPGGQKEPPPDAKRTQTADGSGGPIGPTPGAVKGGPEGAPPRGAFMMMMDPSGMHLRAPSATLGQIVDVISRFTERPVVDMTGIQGQYSFDLEFAPEELRGIPRPMGQAPGKMGEGPEGAPAADNGPARSIFDAVQAYGLKLEPRKAPLEILIIDHIEKTPTEN